MTIDSLLQLMPPPTNPIDQPTSEDWEVIEGQLAIQFPEEVKEIVGSYGSGGFCGFLWFFNPRSVSKQLKIESIFPEILDIIEQSIGSSGGGIKIYPAEDGWAPVAETINGDFLLFRRLAGTVTYGVLIEGDDDVTDIGSDLVKELCDSIQGQSDIELILSSEAENRPTFVPA